MLCHEELKRTFSLLGMIGFSFSIVTRYEIVISYKCCKHVHTELIAAGQLSAEFSSQVSMPEDLQS